MSVNGVGEDHQIIEIEAGDSQVVNFSTTQSTPGTYLVEVAGTSFSFTIPVTLDPIEIKQNSDWPLAAGTAGGIILIMMIILLLLKRRYHIFVKK